MREARYDPMVVQPMPDELTQIGFKEPLRPDDVEVLGAEDRTVLMVVNSACGMRGGQSPAGSETCFEAQRPPRPAHHRVRRHGDRCHGACP